MSALAIGVLLIAVLAVLAGALSRASRDWSCQLRVVQSLWLVGTMDSPEPLTMWEAVLVDRDLSPASRTVVFAPVNRPGDRGLFCLDEPLGCLAERCIGWQAASTPLLFAGDQQGGAVLHGPSGCLVGQVASWSDQMPLDSSSPR
jgi:hypothetical protein